MSGEVAHSFEALRDLAKKSAQFAVGLPAQDEAVEYFSGIGFSFASLRLVAELGTVAEILDVPKFTIIPGVKPWVLGVSNIRGRLIPIIDLARYFGLQAEKARARERRILVVEQGDILSGLMVDSVQGMQHFERSTLKTATAVQIPQSIISLVDGAFEREERDWLVFDAKRLVSDDLFSRVSLTQN
jgi:twitching motility protein PilI